MILKRLFLLLIILAVAGNIHAAARDSLFVNAVPYHWSLSHYAAPGETMLSVSRRYNVPPEVLAEANGGASGAVLSPGSIVTIPLGDYNYLMQPPTGIDVVRPLYYRVIIGDRLASICRMPGLSPDILAQWNILPPGDPFPGRVLLVGWVRYDPTSIVSGPAMVVRPNTPSVVDDAQEYVAVPADTAAKLKPATTTLRELWQEQTAGGQNIVYEKGTAGFFNINGTATGAAVYAFHNSAARGTVILVRNLNNGRAIYVKVLGPLPETKQYAGCVLGLSNGAKAALGARETKVFCEMSYAGY